MKSRLPTEQPAQAERKLSKRPPALVALTVACVLAHAAVLGGLPRMHAAPSHDPAAHSVMSLTNVSIVVPETLQRDAAVPQPSTVGTVSAAVPVRGGGTAHAGQVRTAPVSLREPAPVPLPPATDAAIEHLPTSALDVPPMPRSAPDEQHVEHVHRSGLPIQIRLFIDASGSVTETSLLGAAPGDEEAAERVMVMFRETAFSPGRLQGREVASFIDIELVLEPTLPPLGRIVRQ